MNFSKLKTKNEKPKTPACQSYALHCGQANLKIFKFLRF